MQLEQIIDLLLRCNDKHTVHEDGTQTVERVAPKMGMLLAAKTLVMQQRQIEELSALILRAHGEGFKVVADNKVEEVDAV